MGRFQCDLSETTQCFVVVCLLPCVLVLDRICLVSGVTMTVFGDFDCAIEYFVYIDKLA